MNQLSEAMMAKDMRTSNLSYDQAMDKIARLGEFWEKLETVEGVEEAWLENELNVIDIQKDSFYEKFTAISLIEALVIEQQIDVKNELQDGGVVNLTSNRIPNNNAKKLPELEGTASLKEYEEWHAKIIDYFILTGINECEEK